MKITGSSVRYETSYSLSFGMSKSFYICTLSIPGSFCLFIYFSFLQSKLAQTEKRLQVIKKRADSLREEHKSLREDNLNFKQQAKIVNKAHKEQEVFFTTF